jgi:triacylglycerol lipase
MGGMGSRVAAMAVVVCLWGAAGAKADPPVWDPVASAGGVAATAQGLAADPAKLGESATQMDCTTGQHAPLSPPPGDPFYRPPSPIPAGKPGKVIRLRQICLGNANVSFPYRAWEVMYLTTGALGANGQPSSFHAKPAVATGLLIEPINRGTAVKRPLLAWAPAEDSNSTLIAPSYQIAQWLPGPDASLMQWAMGHGWAVMLPDYEGPDSAFAAGPLEGHAFLDGIRAAEQLSSLAGLDGTDTQVGMWGGSGGAIAVGWAAELQPRYARELKVAAVTMSDVPGDMRSTFDTINDGYVGPGVAFAAALGVATAYPDLVPESLFNDAGTALAAQFRATGTNQYPSAIPPQHIDMYTKCGCNPIDDPKRFPNVAKAIRTVNLGQHVPTAPLFISQSWNDELMPFADTARLVKSYCDRGATLDFRVTMGDEHISEGFRSSVESMAYLAARFSGVAPVDTCSLPDNGGVAPPVHAVSTPPPLPVAGASR